MSQTGVVGVAAQSVFELQKPVMNTQVFWEVHIWFVGQSAVVTQAAHVPERQWGVAPEQSESVAQPLACATQVPLEQLWPVGQSALAVHVVGLLVFGIQQEFVPQTDDSHCAPLEQTISPVGQDAGFDPQPAACNASMPPRTT